MRFYSSDLAYVHHVGFGSFAKRAAPGLLEAFRKSKIHRGLLVDLGCGSGIWLREASRAGYATIGVDISPEMLRLARTVSRSSRLFRGSLHDFKIPPCQAVTAIGETVSYLPPSACGPKSLKPLFRRVADALQPGGMFIFDAITKDPGPAMNYRDWRAGEDWSVLVDVKEDKRRSIVSRDITVFRKAAANYRRSRERHRVGVYSAVVIADKLRDVGLTVTSATSYGELRLGPRRTAFFARMPRKIRSLNL